MCSRNHWWFWWSGNDPKWRWVWNARRDLLFLMTKARSWKKTSFGLDDGSGSFLRGLFKSEVRKTFLKCLAWLWITSGRVGRSFQWNVMNHWGRKLVSQFCRISSSCTFAKEPVFWWILVSLWFRLVLEWSWGFTPLGREWTSLRSVRFWIVFLVVLVRVISITGFFGNSMGIPGYTWSLGVSLVHQGVWTSSDGLYLCKGSRYLCLCVD